MTEQAERFRRRIVAKLLDQTERFRCPACGSTEGYDEDLASVSPAIHNVGPLLRCLQCDQVVSQHRPDDMAGEATLYVPEPEVR